MKFVEIYKLQNDGSQKTVVVCRLGEGGVVCEGDEVFVKGFNEKGIPSYSEKSKDRLFPKDGLIFLENLKFVFKSGYVNASDVKEG
jgi:hypothetical protein